MYNTDTHNLLKFSSVSVLVATVAVVVLVGGAVVITLLVLWRKRRYHKKPSEYDTVISLTK